MINSLKKTLLASLGAVAFTHEKLKEIVDELVSRGELTKEQGKNLFETLVNKGEEESEGLTSRILGDGQSSLRGYLPISRQEFSKLASRVERIENYLGKEKFADDEAGAVDSEPPDEFPGEALPPRQK